MRLFWLAFLALALPAFAQEQLSAKAWLENMSQALRDKQFKISLIQLQVDSIRPLLYLHGTVDGKEVAFLEHLNGPIKNAVRVGNTVTFIEHDQPAYSMTSNRIQGVIPAAFAGDISALEAGYNLVLGGRARIAGRTGQMIRLVPNDEYRYTVQVWVDTASFLPLRYDMLSQDKQLLEQLLVIELFETKTPAPILEEAYQQEWPPVMNPSERADGQNWQFNWLPAGFRVIVRDHHRLIGTHEPVEYIALTDGLSNISIYVARSGDAPIPEELMTRDGISMASERVGNLEVVAVGRVPTQTLVRIASGLRLD
ncbi:MucB/RseB C-terminal domain-containing protein [Shewanella sp. YIC-542]|uniref:MucB/RseB C-terminal domain-containing protein n=1 Tax=Shewanella mytili TaxID=3377111 RepID=UPI00398F2F03